MADSYKLTIMKDGQWREVGCFSSGSSEQFEELDSDQYGISDHSAYIVPIQPGHNWSKDLFFLCDPDETITPLCDRGVAIRADMNGEDETPTLEIANLRTGGLKVVYSFERPIETFSPAVSGTITKAQADEYVRKIQSGLLAYATEAGDSAHVFHIEIYSPNESIVGEIYLLLAAYDFGQITMSIKYTINSNNQLDVTYQEY